MNADNTISMAEFERWERAARAEKQRAVEAFEATGDTENAERARVTLALIDRAVIVAALDNLTKGASGQAVQAMNLMLGFPEILGLEGTALFP